MTVRGVNDLVPTADHFLKIRQQLNLGARVQVSGRFVEDINGFALAVFQLEAGEEQKVKNHLKPMERSLIL